MAVHASVIAVTIAATTASSTTAAAAASKLKGSGNRAGIPCAGREGDLTVVGHVVRVSEDGAMGSSAATVGVVLVGAAVRMHGGRVRRGWLRKMM